MFIISAVLVVLVTASLFYTSFSFLANKTVYAMEYALDSTTTVNMKPIYSNNISGKTAASYNGYDGLIITVVADRNGNILAANCNRSGEKLVKEELAGDTLKVINSKKKSGYIGNGKQKRAFRYMKKDIKDGYKIVFADREEEVETFQFLLLHYIIADIAVLAFVFVFVRYIAKRAVMPVDMAIKEQKRFIADVSHELKTPLSVIMANVDIMVSNPESTISDNMRWVDNTKTEARRMNKLIHDMLLLAKTDTITSASEEVHESVDFSDLVEGCVMTIEVLAFERSLVMKEDIEKGIYVTGDKDRLERLVTILMENAMKYVDESGLIEICLKNYFEYVQFTVTNTGIPIPDEKQGQVFHRFFRADESRSKAREGYGLGLSIARNITENHGGIIELLYSDEERGTCFSVKLPHEGDGRLREFAILPPQKQKKKI